MTILEWLLGFAVVTLVLWLVSVMLAEQRVQARAFELEIEVVKQRDLNDAHLEMLNHRDTSVEVLRDECKRLEHDLDQYKDAACEWERAAALQRDKARALESKIYQMRRVIG